MSSSYPASRFVSMATLGYAAFAALKPRHLAEGLEAPADQAPGLDRLAYAYSVRDVAISALALAPGAGPTRVRTSIGLRVAGDLLDAATLAAKAPDAKVRAKVLTVTLGWAVVNLSALAWDERRAS